MYNQNMFVIPPADWKYIRRLFTPVFSSAKLKVMVRNDHEVMIILQADTLCSLYIWQSYLMHKCTEDFISDIGVHADQDIAFDAIDSTKKFSLDIIASCAYGIEVNE